MRRTVLAAVMAMAILGRPAEGAKIRDVATVVGARSNHLIGYGLVIGLKGTGDRSPAALKAARRILDNIGWTLTSGELRTKNIALVMVTAELQPWLKEGVKCDAFVSAIGDAESLQGGYLLTTPLHAADPEAVYARAQGSISFGGALKPVHPNSGRIPCGATVEREVPVVFTKNDAFELAVRTPGFALAQNIADVINNYVWLAGESEKGRAGDIAVAVSPGLVRVTIPEWEWARKRPVAFMRDLLSYPVDVDLPARVVVNERTGTVAVNEAVRVGPAAVSHGDLYVEIPAAGGAGGGGRAADVAAAGAAWAAGGARGHVVPVSQGVTLQEVVQQLNRMKVTPRDLIAVLDKLIRVGALSAELIVE